MNYGVTKAMDVVLTLAREAHKAEIATPCDLGLCDTFGGI